VEHHLRHEDAFEELLVHAEAASGAAALEGATAGFGVVGAVAAFALHLAEPGEDLAQSLPRIVGAVGVPVAPSHRES